MTQTGNRDFGQAINDLVDHFTEFIQEAGIQQFLTDNPYYIPNTRTRVRTISNRILRFIFRATRTYPNLGYADNGFQRNAFSMYDAHNSDVMARELFGPENLSYRQEKQK